MASPEVIELESLLGPISEDSPAGEDIRADRTSNSAFYQIKDARERARNAERNIMLDEENRNTAIEEWRNILKLAPAILQDKSKDLEVCAWYIEGLVRLEGYAGLRDGMKLAAELASRYWDNIFPIPDEDDYEDVRETRAAPFAGLNGEGRDGTLIQPIRDVPITEEHELGPYAYWQYQQAIEIQKVHDDDARQERIESAGVSIDLFDRAMNDSSATFCLNLVEDLEGAIAAFEELGTVFDEKAGEFSPPSSNIRNNLKEILGAIKHKASDKLASSEPEVSEEGEPVEGGAPAQAQSGGAGASLAPGMNIADAVLKSREDAFKQLLKLSDYFRKTEPHSPVSYALEKAVRWGRMPLHELMGELLMDSQSKENYEMLTGVKLDPDN